MTDAADARVDAYIDALPDWQQAICREVRDLVHAADHEVAETIKRHQPSAVGQHALAIAERVVERLLVYVIAPAVSGAALLRMTKMTLLTRTKTRRSRNPMRSRTSPNEAITPPRPNP